VTAALAVVAAFVISALNAEKAAEVASLVADSVAGLLWPL
jgi:hypothetical protein